MALPYTFADRTGRVPASYLDADFAYVNDVSNATGILPTNRGGTGGDTSQEAAENLSIGYVVADLTALKALTSRPPEVLIRTGKGKGIWAWNSGNQSANVTADPQEGIWAAPASAPTGASGAWGRQYIGGRWPIWFGAAADGVTDDSAYVQAAIDTYGNSRGQIVFGPYPYKINGVEVLQGSIHLQGAGKTVTDIYVSDGTANIFTFGGTTFDSAITGMRIIYSGVGTPSAGSAIYETNGVGAITIQDIRIEGLWNGIECYNLPNDTISGVVKIINTDIGNVENDGLYVDGMSQLFMQSSTVACLPAATGLGNAGIHIVNGGGFYINNTTCGGMDYGLRCDPSTGQKIYNLFLTNYESDSCGVDGYHFDATGGGSIETVLIAACRAGFCGRFGVVMNGGELNDVRIIGSEIQKSGEHGIFIIGGNGIEIDSTFVRNNGSLVPGCYGINVFGGDNVSIIGGMGSTYQLESPTQAYHLVVQSGFTGTLLVDGFNAATDYVTGGIFDSSTSTDVKIINCPGFNPRGFLIPSVGASPWSYTAGPSDECVMITGGTVSAIQYGAFNTFLTSPCSLTLPAGTTMTVTYSVAPTVCAIGA